MPDPQPSRLLSLDDVADELAISHSQAYALVRRRDLLAIQVGGRGQWHVERVKLEEYIARLYEEAARPRCQPRQTGSPADSRYPGLMTGWGTPGQVAALVHRPAATVRDWARDLRVPAACDLRTRRLVVDALAAMDLAQRAPTRWDKRTA